MIFKKLLSQSITATLALSTLLSAVCTHADPHNNSSMSTIYPSTVLVQTELAQTALVQAGEAAQTPEQASCATDSAYAHVSREEVVQLREQIKAWNDWFTKSQNEMQIKALQQEMATLHLNQANLRVQQLEYYTQQLQTELARKKPKTVSATDALKFIMLLAPLAKHIPIDALAKHASMPNREQATHAGKLGGYVALTATSAALACNSPVELGEYGVILGLLGICYGAKKTHSAWTGK